MFCFNYTFLYFVREDTYEADAIDSLSTRNHFREVNNLPEITQIVRDRIMTETHKGFQSSCPFHSAMLFSIVIWDHRQHIYDKIFTLL